MKIQHYIAIVSSYLLCVVMSVVAFGELSQAFTLIRSGASVWEGRSQLFTGLASLGLAYFLWRWAASVRKNALLSLQLKKRLDAEQAQGL